MYSERKTKLCFDNCFFLVSRKKEKEIRTCLITHFDLGFSFFFLSKKWMKMIICLNDFENLEMEEGIFLQNKNKLQTCNDYQTSLGPVW